MVTGFDSVLVLVLDRATAVCVLCLVLRAERS